MSKKCRVCGNEIADGVVFCQRCGKPVDYSGVMNTSTNINRAENQYSAMAITALVLGIFSLLLCWVPILGFGLEITTIIIGKIEMSNNRNAKSKTMAKIGFTLGIIALALGIILLLWMWIESLISEASSAGFEAGYNSGYDSGYNVPWYNKIFN